ncbi:hypothetical protein [Curvibacter microcysteis]|uniref:hypothetical protein n=1 Tax=Curvibacter microcysteis TaxID=3026419 RepID=UPI0023630DE3|nr:hypothetical protein [Curvibacter sp. RS43]
MIKVTDCDMMLVAGTDEVTLDSGLLPIAAQGSCWNSVDMDAAEVWGRFDDRLRVREKLVFRAIDRACGRVFSSQ